MKIHSSFYVASKQKKENVLKKNIATTVKELISDTVLSLGCVVWDVEYQKIGSDWNLTVTIDNNDGITIEDCEAVHRAIDPILDEADPIEGAYRLTVSSPGIERELKNDFHIESCIGDKVEVRLFAPLNGKKSYIGILTAYENNELTVACEDGEIRILRSAASRIETRYDWND